MAKPKASVPILDIYPPLINSANPWATTLDDLRRLHACPHTGAVTTRTSLINGFAHDDSKHYYVFFDPASHKLETDEKTASLNSLGYSPLDLQTYLSFVKTISDELLEHEKQLQGKSVGEEEGKPEQQQLSDRWRKGFIVSVTGTPDEAAQSYKLISKVSREVVLPLAMEVNLSCPNIPDKPPPAYSKEAVIDYLGALKAVLSEDDDLPRIPIGLKTPPYTYATQFETLVSALEASDPGENEQCLVSFLTATNTLGSCLAFHTDESALDLGISIFALPGHGLGGMAGAPLHPLALGNVATLRRMTQERMEKLGHIRIIGIGGVLDAGGYQRMKAVGASVVGVGTGLGLKGVGIFEEMARDLDYKRAW
ncbi:hypothetical protein B0H66DRAFT_160275 [Apodospora peruviana]|uniref:Dihydroorotate dehydrogenase (fumarate) n=1 Tax=Apodospora peruviana TaxID=516989 RepID=A0AAE0IJT0_9PEZI|nr:hypothetical protein B0H66DRAFT_160275 [Apodospora peruviana]